MDEHAKDDGKGAPLLPSFELRIVWNQETQEVKLTGCLDNIVISQGLLKAAERLLLIRQARSFAGAAPVVSPAAVFPVRRG